MKWGYKALLLKILFVFLIICPACVNGQKNLPLINSLEILREGIGQTDSGAYDKASALFEQISRNDTNYILALFEDALSHVSNQQDSLAIIICDKGLAIPSEYEPDFIKLKGSALIDLKKYDDAIDLLRAEITKFPRLYQLHFTLGLAYYKAQRYDSAVASLERSINLNAFHASSHYYLGKCCLEQGRVIPALLSLQFCLVLEPRTTRSFSVVQLIERVTENKYEFNKATKVDPAKYGDEPFSELELLVQSQAAINKEYKAESKVNYNVIKQCQLIYDKLKFVPNTNNFWMNQYVSFFVDMRKSGTHSFIVRLFNPKKVKNYFEPYSYYILQSVNDDALQNELKKKKKKVDEFVDWASKQIVATRHTRDIVIDGKNTKVICYYYSSRLLQSMGPENAKGKHIGEWTFYNENNGTVSAKGSYDDNGNHTGLWQYYYFDGTPKEKTMYGSNDKRNGPSERWHENGAVKAKCSFKNDMLDSTVEEFNTSGVPTILAKYKEDKPIGKATLFYSDGRKQYELNYNAQGLDSVQKTYYVTEQLESVSIYNSGKKNGKATNYWANGKIKSEGEYTDDNTSGHWKFFYSDGSLEEEADYLNDKVTGPLIIFYRNGKKKEETAYDAEGKLTGTDVLYDFDGVKYEQKDYLKGIVQHYIFWDKKGKVLTESSLKDNKITMDNYYPNGIQQSDGELLNNKREGEWEFYSRTGVLFTVENYSEGDLEGEATNYFVNGKIKDEQMYKGDAREGYYKKYYINGAIATEGWYLAGKVQGDWYYYDRRGNIKSQDYYINDKLSGYEDFYDPNGKITEEEHRYLGYLDKVWVYDSTGKNVTYAYASDKGNGHYFSTFINGQTRVDRTYISGKADGTEKTYYYNGKLSSECNLLLGKLDGPHKEYYSNGDLYSVNNYNLGDLSGSDEGYFKGSKLKIKENYFEDDIDGPVEEHYEAGNLRRTGQEVEGRNQGKFYYYSQDSLLYCVRWYYNGVAIAYSYPGKNGKLIDSIPIKSDSEHIVTYYANGTKALEHSFIHGCVNGPRTEYFSNGNVSKQETYYYDDLNGPQKYYYSNGKPKAEENYYYGERDGKSIYYYESGQVEIEKNWALGNKQGTFTYYNTAGNITKTIVYYDGHEVYELDNEKDK